MISASTKYFNFHFIWATVRFTFYRRAISFLFFFLLFCRVCRMNPVTIAKTLIFERLLFRRHNSLENFELRCFHTGHRTDIPFPKKKVCLSRARGQQIFSDHFQCRIFQWWKRGNQFSEQVFNSKMKTKAGVLLT